MEDAKASLEKTGILTLQVKPAMLVCCTNLRLQTSVQVSSPKSERVIVSVGATMKGSLLGDGLATAHVQKNMSAEFYSVSKTRSKSDGFIFQVGAYTPSVA